MDNIEDLEVIFNSEVVGVLILKNRVVTRCSRSVEEMFGYDKGELDNQCCRIWYPSDEAFEEYGKRVYKDLLDFNRHYQEMLFKRKDGSFFWGRASGSAFNQAEPHKGSVWLFEDISARKAIEDDLKVAYEGLEAKVEQRTKELLLINEKLKEEIFLRLETEKRIWHMANHDALTGLPNRNLLVDRLKIALVQAKRDNHKVGVMFMDLDHFKLINDNYGHPAGDELLCLVAGKLRRATRDTDTVARMGGDEFVIILNRINSKEDAEVVAKKIIDSMKESMMVEGHEVKTSPSIGIAIYPDNGLETSMLLKNADDAMYKSKSKGRNTYNFYIE
jgi:diguanylate cyclase (GGDEF)-like protein/PAS domain S-box-containing protein